MKREQFEKAVNEYREVLALQDKKGSTGSTGKLMEVVVRDFIMAHGIRKASDVRCRKAGRADARQGRNITVEIKTGSGAVAYGAGLTKADILPENILPGVKLIAWAPFSGFLTTENFREMFWVFTREQFIETLACIGKKGLASSVKVSKGGAQLNIQTITPRMEDRLWEILDSLPTLEEYFGEG